ncbi:hypothetical protein ABVT39_014688 [Epinephelus coioides]
MSGNANRATPLRGSRPPGFPAIGSSLKVTLQSGHADVAGLAVGMEPVPPPPLPPLSLPPTTHSTPLPPPPPPPQRHSSYPCWARSAPRSTPLAASGTAMIGDTRTKEYGAAVLGLSDSMLIIVVKEQKVNDDNEEKDDDDDAVMITT